MFRHGKIETCVFSLFNLFLSKYRWENEINEQRSLSLSASMCSFNYEFLIIIYIVALPSVKNVTSRRVKKKIKYLNIKYTLDLVRISRRKFFEVLEEGKTKIAPRIKYHKILKFPYFRGFALFYA